MGVVTHIREHVRVFRKILDLLNPSERFLCLVPWRIVPSRLVLRVFTELSEDRTPVVALRVSVEIVVIQCVVMSLVVRVDSHALIFKFLDLLILHVEQPNQIVALLVEILPLLLLERELVHETLNLFPALRLRVLNPKLELLDHLVQLQLLERRALLQVAQFLSRLLQLILVPLRQLFQLPLEVLFRGLQLARLLLLRSQQSLSEILSRFLPLVQLLTKRQNFFVLLLDYLLEFLDPFAILEREVLQVLGLLLPLGLEHALFLLQDRDLLLQLRDETLIFLARFSPFLAQPEDNLPDLLHQDQPILLPLDVLRVPVRNKDDRLETAQHLLLALLQLSQLEPLLLLRSLDLFLDQLEPLFERL